MQNYIEVHEKRCKSLRRVSVCKSEIIEIAETKRGAAIRYLLHDGWGYLVTLHCVESYDEVLALINK